MQDQRQPTVDVLVERAFATEMVRLREDRGMSQTRLAQELEQRYRIKIDGTAITRIERRAHDKPGARALTLGEAVAIAGILGISIDGLTNPTANMSRELEEARRRVEALEDRRNRADAEYVAARSEYEQLQLLAERFSTVGRLEARHEELSKHRAYLIQRRADIEHELTERDDEDVRWRLAYAETTIDRIDEELSVITSRLAKPDAEAANTPSVTSDVAAKRDMILHELAKKAATIKEQEQAGADYDVIVSLSSSDPAREKAIQRLSKLLARKGVPREVMDRTGDSGGNG